MVRFVSKRAGRLAALVVAAWVLTAGVSAAHEKARIVSVGGAVTEIVFALGKSELLIARDSTSLYPEQARALPDVGYMRQLSPEGVLSVNPTSVLMIDGSGPKQSIEVLTKSSVPITVIPEGYDRDAVVKKILAVGAAIDANSQARRLADKVAAEIDEAVAKTSTVPEGKRKRVLFVLTMQNGKIMAAGHHTAADGILKLAGAVNVATGFNGYKPLNDEAVVDAAPDLILMMSNAGPGASNEDVLNHPGIKLTPAGKNGEIMRIDGASLLGFGPRTATAILTLNKNLYGG